jgi:COMPASS component SDC1
MPAEAGPHGAPVRQYLNGNVTGPLLEGMKMIAKEQ